MKRLRARVLNTLKILFIIIGGALGLLSLLVAAESMINSISTTPLSIHLDKNSASSLMGSLAEVLAGVLGLSLTVVAIVVQLASQRYSPKIAELFMQDPLNRSFAGFMVMSCIYVVVLATLGGQHPPVLAFWGGIVLAVVNIALLLPYFQHVFSFLQPQNIIRQIELSARQAVSQAIAKMVPSHWLQVNRKQVATAVERIADICLAAINQSDRNLALNSIRTLERFVVNYLSQKEHLPEAWAYGSSELFISISDEFRTEIANTNTWIEAHILMELDHILRRHTKINEVLTQIASSTRNIGQAALYNDDEEALDLCVRFFNTYIRHALNARNVRGVYNILYQYRQLSETLMEAQPETCRKIVDRLVYYGRLANELKLPFATVTFAHDVHALCKVAYQIKEVDVLPLLELFLSLDQPSEGKAEELALLGVRKAQTLLGAFFLSEGATELAAYIQHDMRDEPAQRLRKILDTLLNTEERKFWEINDRGIDFDYVDPELRPFVEQLITPLIEAIEQPSLIITNTSAIETPTPDSEKPLIEER